jgi:hypothetical protein
LLLFLLISHSLRPSITPAIYILLFLNLNLHFFHPNLFIPITIHLSIISILISSIILLFLFISILFPILHTLLFGSHHFFHFLLTNSQFPLISISIPPIHLSNPLLFSQNLSTPIHSTKLSLITLIFFYSTNRSVFPNPRPILNILNLNPSLISLNESYPILTIYTSILNP